jgi:outer membrane protein assembly factor BamB
MKFYSLLVLLLSVSVMAADWSQWRGPTRDGKSTETGWLSKWPESGPKVLWKKENIGKGFSAFTIAKGKAYICGNKDNADTIYCFDAKTGKEFWTYKFPEPLLPKYYPGGTSASVTVHDGTTYSFSKTGKVYALNAETGKMRWTTDVVKAANNKQPTWGFASTPLIMGDKLILNCGKSGLCLDKETGKVLWKSADAKCGYSTPCPIDEKTVGIFSTDTLYAVEVDSGKIKWQQAWKTKYGENNADVLVYDNHLILTATHDMGTTLFKIGDKGLTPVWKNKLGMQLNGYILHEGFLYGSEGRVNKKPGSFYCLDAKTGKTMWNIDGMKAFATFADGKLIVMSISGELIIAEANPKGYKEISKIKVFDNRRPQTWTVPILADGMIFCRDVSGKVVCFDVNK